MLAPTLNQKEQTAFTGYCKGSIPAGAWHASSLLQWSCLSHALDNMLADKVWVSR